MTSLQVENPTIVRIARETGLTITTDAQGKADAVAQLKQHGGIMVESRYFVGGELFTRSISRNASGNAIFEWKCGGETFTTPQAAIRKALATLGIVSR